MPTLVPGKAHILSHQHQTASYTVYVLHMGSNRIILPHCYQFEFGEEGELLLPTL